MIRTVEMIEISETTTSYRVTIDEVNPTETLDERYQRHLRAAKEKEKEPAQPTRPTPA